MEVDLRKPNEWVGIANEPNCKFAIVHVCVLLFKGPAHLPCFALIPLCLALPCPIHSTLPLPPLCLALPCLDHPIKQKQNPSPLQTLICRCLV
jgi:hypothetical protein